MKESFYVLVPAGVDPLSDPFNPTHSHTGSPAAGSYARRGVNYEELARTLDVVNSKLDTLLREVRAQPDQLFERVKAMKEIIPDREIVFIESDCLGTDPSGVSPSW